MLLFRYITAFFLFTTYWTKWCFRRLLLASGAYQLISFIFRLLMLFSQDQLIHLQIIFLFKQNTILISSSTCWVLILISKYIYRETLDGHF